MNTVAKKKLTVMLDAEVYAGLQEKVGGRKMGAFLSDLARPHVVTRSLDEGYKAMSRDARREHETKEWIESDVEISDSENVWQF